MSNLIIPPKLNKGDTIAIVSPASIIRHEYVAGAKSRLEEAGYNVIVGKNALNQSGSFAGNIEERLHDMTDALCDKEVKAIMCSRGGYGCVHLLNELSKLDIANNAKWLVGFSDVSALHALMTSKGVASIHGSMTKALALNPLSETCNARLIDLLSGKFDTLSWPKHEYNVNGKATGRLVGGNLAVIQALISTPFSPFHKGDILFIEDIAEPIYKVERIMYQLRLAGILDNASGLVIGRFTDYKPSRDFSTMEDMLHKALHGLSLPIAFGAPIGHVDNNMPVIYGAMHRLDVTDMQSSITPLINLD